MVPQKELFIILEEDSTGSSEASDFFAFLLGKLRDIRGLEIVCSKGLNAEDALTLPQPRSILHALSLLIEVLTYYSRLPEADALDNALEKCKEPIEYGGLALGDARAFTADDKADVMFQVEAWLVAVNSVEKARRLPSTISIRADSTRPMTLAQKILAYHAIDGCPVEGISTGHFIRVSVDWILASELSMMGMMNTIDAIGRPSIFRNDRFWLAGDHVYHPSIAEKPVAQRLYQISERAKKEYKMTEYQGMNYTIMHTEFVRERAQPGMLVIGSDSHTCSAGAMGSLSIGLGAVDVAMALITGETWFKVPESIRIELNGKPKFGISGKDVILHILRTLKRNTVAAERIVEFTGPGLSHLSIDARFAISNMCTEFGAITGIFTPDATASAYVNRRRKKAGKSSSVYFRHDPGALYADSFDIDLSDVEPTIAVYPEPDNVVPVSEQAGLHLDGVFIGACTTTEEELVLAALVLKVGLKRQLPLARGKRHVVPGSLPIVEKLRKLNLLEVFEAAGFTRGPPGCSYCVGISADQAGDGERWLSSQNRNFKNRMGAGSIGSITSAAVVAASSFSMTVTDCAPFIEDLDTMFFEAYVARSRGDLDSSINFQEPRLGGQYVTTFVNTNVENDGVVRTPAALRQINGSVIKLGDFIDTDALAPAQVLATARTDQDFGDHCLEHTYPEFREKARSGRKIVVAGKAFGVGSSREEAVRALKGMSSRAIGPAFLTLTGLGIQAVIARSFAFIYGRNQASFGLLGFSIDQDEFYTLAAEDTSLEIDIPTRTVRVGQGDSSRAFSFSLTQMEHQLIINGGVSEAYKKHTNDIWRAMIGPTPESSSTNVVKMVDEILDETTYVDRRTQW